MENDISESWKQFDESIRNGGRIFHEKEQARAWGRAKPETGGGLTISIRDSEGHRYVGIEELIDLLPQSTIDKIVERFSIRLKDLEWQVDCLKDRIESIDPRGN